MFLMLGFLSLVSLMFVIPNLNNDFIRECIVYYETIFFCLLNSSLVVCMFRYVFSTIALRSHKFKLAQFFTGEKLFICAILFFSLNFLGLGMYHGDHPIEQHDEVILKEGTNEINVAFVSDVHLGGGTFKRNVDYLKEKLSETNSDVLLIIGDLTDATSSQSDIEYFAKTIGSMSFNKGIYYTNGNHEKDSRFELLDELAKYGIKYLENEAVYLDDDLILVGRDYSNDKSVKDIVKDSGIKEDKPIIIMQHVPKLQGNEYEENSLVLSGHTHAYWTVIYKGGVVFFDDFYGYKQIGNTQMITSAGTSTWGYHSSYPSNNEYNTVKVRY